MGTISPYKTFQIIWARHHIKHLQDRWCPCWLLKMCCWPQITHQTCLVSWSNFNRPSFNFSIKAIYPPFCFDHSRPPTLVADSFFASLWPPDQTCLVGGHFWGCFPRLRQGHGHQCQLPYVVRKVYCTVLHCTVYTESVSQTVPAGTIHHQKNDWGKKHGKAELFLIEVLEKHPKPTITRWKIFAEKASLCW